MPLTAKTLSAQAELLKTQQTAVNKLTDQNFKTGATVLINTQKQTLIDNDIYYKDSATAITIPTQTNPSAPGLVGSTSGPVVLSDYEQALKNAMTDTPIPNNIPTTALEAESVAMQTPDLNYTDPSFPPDPVIPVNPIITTAPTVLPDFSGFSLPVFFKDPGIDMISLETPSAIMVMNRKTSAIQYQTNRFFLQSLTKPQQEKFQIMETFGDPHVFFYGDRTKMYTLQGVLLDGFYRENADDATNVWNTARKNAANKNMWATAMQQFYNDHLRGTALKNEGNIAALYVNGWLIKGYPVNLTIMKESNSMPDVVTFQMSWVIEQELLLRGPDVEYQYKMLDQTNKLVSLVNSLSAKQSDYFNFRSIYQTLASTLPPVNSVTLKAAQSKYQSLVPEITELQRQISILMSANSKKNALLNMD